MPHHIILGDLSTFKADVIVNSAHPYPMEGTGVDRALYKQAGPELLAARNQFGILKTGDLVKSDAYQLNALKVYHVITPHVSSKESSSTLASLYQTIFKEALLDQVTSIALPLLASGNHGFDLEEALVIARREIVQCLEKHDLDIYLLIYDKAQVQRDVPEFNRVDDLQLSIVHHELRAAEALEIRSKTFHQWLFDWIDKEGLADPFVYKKANLTRQHFSKIRSNPTYQPTKYTVIALALALELNLDQTYDFLETAGYTLSSSILFDIIIEYHITHQIYEIFEINEVLFLYDQRTLG